MTKLKNCPGCGEDYGMVIGGPGTVAGPEYWVGCRACNWRVFHEDEARAIEIWNTREQDDDQEFKRELSEVLKAEKKRWPWPWPHWLDRFIISEPPADPYDLVANEVGIHPADLAKAVVKHKAQIVIDAPDKPDAARPSHRTRRISETHGETDMSEEPKKCPFCDGEAEVYHHNPPGWVVPSVHIECELCGCGTCHHETRVEAVRAWNRRPS